MLIIYYKSNGYSYHISRNKASEKRVSSKNFYSQDNKIILNKCPIYEKTNNLQYLKIMKSFTKNLDIL